MNRVLFVTLGLVSAFWLPIGCVAASAPEPGTAEAWQRLIYGLPKAELHVHFEGTLEPEQYLELVRRNGLASTYDSAQAVRDRLTYAKDLNTFIEVYEELLGAMRTRQDFQDVATAAFRKLHSQGVVYVEMFFDPQMHTTRGIPITEVMEALIAARTDARRELGLRVEYILCFNRDRSAASAQEHLDACLPWREAIVGVGLDNPEENGFPAKFAPVFARARSLGFRLTSHCDVNQPNSLAHIRGCLDTLQVERIDHGLNVLDDPSLVTLIRERGVGLTACVTEFYRPIPNRVESRAGAVHRLLELGVLVCVNSDDPGLMRSRYAADCLQVTQAAAGLSHAQVFTLVKNGFRLAWISESDRQAYLKAVDDFAATR